MKDEEIRKAVREGYGKIAVQDARNASGCGLNSCACGCSVGSSEYTVSKAIGYSDAEISAVPDGANLGLGCGNPTAVASLKEGEVVLDLGSGAGFDCFLAADRVGVSGMVIGVDMTAEMIEKARENAKKGGYRNVEFRLGEIENLPVADNMVNVVISNCVVNLSPDKKRVYEEVFRVLKPGGRIMVSDIALLKELPAALKGNMAAYVGCVAGATTREEYLATVAAAGFKDVEIVNEVNVKGLYDEATVSFGLTEDEITKEQLREAGDSMISMHIQAIKPI
ncbi:arsenite methyltransferase [Chloroflexota bacterium]